MQNAHTRFNRAAVQLKAHSMCALSFPFHVKEAVAK